MELIYTFFSLINVYSIFSGRYHHGPERAEGVHLIITKALPAVYLLISRGHIFFLFFALGDVLFQMINSLQEETQELLLGGLLSFGTGHLLSIDYVNIKTHQIVFWLALSNIIYYSVSRYTLENIRTREWVVKFYYVNAVALAQSQRFSVIYIADILTMINVVYEDNAHMSLFRLFGLILYWTGLYLL